MGIGQRMNGSSQPHAGSGTSGRGRVAFVHCGLHKTGTTSLRTRMRQIPSNKNFSFNYLETGGFILKDGTFDQDFANTFSMSKRIRAKNLVFASPNFLGLPWNGYADAVRNLRSLHVALSRTHQVHYVLYLRPQPEWVESCAVQWIQQGNSDSPNSMARRILNSRHIRYSLLIEDLLTLIPNHSLTVRIYRGQDSVEDFLTLLECGTDASVEQAVGANASLKMGEVRLLQELNRTLPLRESQTLRRLLQQRPRDPIHTRGHFLSQPIWAKLHEVAVEDWHELARYHLSKRSSTSSEFKEIAGRLQVPTPICDPEDALVQMEKYSAAVFALEQALYNLQGQLGPMTTLGSFIHRIRWRGTNERSNFIRAVRLSIRERTMRSR